MAHRFKKISTVLFYILAALYPVLIYYFLVIRKIPLRMFSLFIIAFAFFAFIVRTSSPKGRSRGTSFFWTSLLLFGVGALCLITNSAIILKFYPVLMNILFLMVFGITCFVPPTMIFRFATMQDKTIKGSLGEKRIDAYCRKVTYAWCMFFVFNGSVAAWTIFSGSDALWSVYNGGISYILTGIFFAGEFVIRKMVQKKIPQAVPLSAIQRNSRSLSAVVCYEGSYHESVHKTWKDFLEGTDRLRRQIQAVDSGRWILYCEDCWYFLLAFTALLQCKKEILLSTQANLACNSEICGGAPLLTDQAFAKLDGTENVLHIAALLSADSPAELVPPVNADEASIVMYASESTGKPAEVRLWLTELENENRSALAQWGEEFLKRTVCSTVNQHHIYGLLFSILLPFTAGVPFRRQRIAFPEELEKLSDTAYMIITTPAFLERAVETKNTGASLASPWIFTSCGVLGAETARKASEVFGFRPVEVCGSTETLAAAWRQSANGKVTGGFDSLGAETVIEQTENSISLEIYIPETCLYFDGHFPGFPIMPAVAQMEMVIRFASRYLGTGVALSAIRRIKFTNLVRPNMPLLVKLAKKDHTLTFTICSAKGEITYSSGTVVLEKK